MMGDRQHLNQSINFAVNKVKVKNFEYGASNVRRRNDARAIR